jgi:hypothetical protein
MLNTIITCKVALNWVQIVIMNYCTCNSMKKYYNLIKRKFTCNKRNKNNLMNNILLRMGICFWLWMNKKGMGKRNKWRHLVLLSRVNRRVFNNKRLVNKKGIMKDNLNNILNKWLHNCRDRMHLKHLLIMKYYNCWSIIRLRN